MLIRFFSASFQKCKHKNTTISIAEIYHACPSKLVPIGRLISYKNRASCIKDTPILKIFSILTVPLQNITAKIYNIININAAMYCGYSFFA